MSRDKIEKKLQNALKAKEIVIKRIKSKIDRNRNLIEIETGGHDHFLERLVWISKLEERKVREN